MKAVLMTATGGPQVLALHELPTPVIEAPGQVLVRLAAASVNPLDVKMREGHYPMAALPLIPGWDAAGVVEAVGEEVQSLAPGDEVWLFHGSFGNAPGCYAEYALVSERNVAPKPKSLDFVHAAAVPLALLTAWEALFERAQLQPGHEVLIHAGAGGVGHLAVQLAAHHGARVITTVGSAAKAEFVSALGARETVLYKETDFAASVLGFTSGRGVDVALDTVGGPLLAATVPAIAHYGDLVTLVNPDPGLDLAPARMRSLRLSFELVIAPLLFGLEPEQLRQRDILNAARALFDTGHLRVEVSETLPLARAPDAHRAIARGSTTGKIVLVMD